MAPGLAPEELRRLQQRSDARGLLRLAGHLVAIVGTGALYVLSRQGGHHAVLTGLAAGAFGFTLVTLFAAMHECVHRTAFRAPWLSNSVGWLAGLLSFYNSTFYRYYHGDHHRFTQRQGRDPELDDPKPTHLRPYLLELCGLYWWTGKLRTYAAIVLGRVSSYPYLSPETRPRVVRSVRLQVSVYGAAIALSCALGAPLFVTYWLFPVVLAQPLLRAILMAEHTGCGEDDDALRNTRTTHTSFAVRFLMWEMPYHAEHHRYPALPFFALAEAHATLGPHVAHIARSGYVGFHVALVRQLLSRTQHSFAKPGAEP